jgi:hypothetical protein
MLINLDSTQSLFATKDLKIGDDISIAGFLTCIFWKGGYELFDDNINQKNGLLLVKERYLIDINIEDNGFDSDGAAKTARKSMIINRDLHVFIDFLLIG